MAKFIPGPLISEIRGALGNQIFARNQYHAYTRARTEPNNFPSPARVIQKERMTAAATAWSATLTELERTSWNAYALAQTKRKGPINGKAWTGRAAYISQFLNLTNISVTPLTTPPDQPTSGLLGPLTLAIDADTRTFTLDGTVPTGAPSQGLTIFATPPLNPGRYQGLNQQVQIKTLSPGWTFPIELWDDYIPKLDTPGFPWVVIVYARAIAASSGLPSTMQKVRAQATGSGGPLLFKTTVLTDTQIKALPTTPITILSGIAGKQIIPVAIVLQLDASAAAYTNVTAGVGAFLSLFVGDEVSTHLRNDAFLAAALKKVSQLTPASFNDAVPNTQFFIYSNAATQSVRTGMDATLHCTNAAGDFTGGNAANQLTATIFYNLIDPI